jgi:DNA-binding transcriptional LysR family regulator
MDKYGTLKTFIPFMRRSDFALAVAGALRSARHDVFRGGRSRLEFHPREQGFGHTHCHVSRRIALMEKRVRVRLFQRTTRRLALTEPGRRYLERCERIVQEAAAAHEVLKEAAERLTGHLRISMPVEFGLTLIAPIIDEFARQYPEITVDAELSSRPADFVDQNIDVSIRLGELRDPSLIVRRLGSAARLFYASPSYLARYGVPRHPKDLGKHECILQSYMARIGRCERARPILDEQCLDDAEIRRAGPWHCGALAADRDAGLRQRCRSASAHGLEFSASPCSCRDDVPIGPGEG